jgi:hypothetical protein
MVVTLKTYSKTIMKTNFKKLTRDEQLMVNGGAVGRRLYCRFYPLDRMATPGPCVSFPVVNGNPCQHGFYNPYDAGSLLCSGYLGGASKDYYVANEFSACFC